VKRNISEFRKDRETRISCLKCGLGVGIVPIGMVLSRKSSASESIDYSCTGCLYEQTIYVRSPQTIEH